MKAAVHYSPEVADKILGRMIAGLSVTRIARQPGMPTKAAIMKWVETKPEFREVYLRAQEGRGCTYAEKAVECEGDYNAAIADVRSRRITPSQAMAIINGLRAKVDVFKWAAGRMAPKIFGEKVDHNVSGAIKHDHQHDLSKLSDAELDALEGIVGKAAADVADPSREDETRH
jgi:hypothetical protein